MSSLLLLAVSATCAGRSRSMVVGARRHLRERVVALHPEWDVREWSIERFLPADGRLRIDGFGSGGGLTSVVQDTPRAVYQFSYYQPQHPMGGLVAWERSGRVLPLNAPTNVVGVTSDGIALYLDASTGLIKANTISLQRAVVTALDSGRVIQSACATDARTMAFIEPGHPDTLFLRALDGGGTRVYPLLHLSVGSPPPLWTNVRISGSMGAGCVLWAPRWPTVVTMTDTSVHAAWRFVDHVRPPWYQRLADWVLRTGAAPLTRGMTVVPGAVAVLSPGGDRVSLYRIDTGSYLETVTLSRPALCIAGAGPRLFTLSESGGRIFFASNVLPDDILSGVVARASSDTVKAATPTWLRSMRENGA